MSALPSSAFVGLEPSEQQPFAEPVRILEPIGTERSVRLASQDELPDLSTDAERRGLLSVLIPAPSAADRGKLGLVVEEAIESALERRGACAPGIGAACDLDASLGDQLYRARLVELRGLFVALGPLEGIAGLAGALDAEDSAVLRFWLEAPRTRPVELAIDESNREVAVYGAPVALSSLLVGGSRPVAEAVPDVSPAIAASARAMELSETPPAVAETAPSSSEPALAGVLAQALVSELTPAEADALEPPAHTESEAFAPAPAEAHIEADAFAPAPAEAHVESDAFESTLAEAHTESDAFDTPEAPPALDACEPSAPHAVAVIAPELAAVPAQLELAAELAKPLDPTAGDAWPTWLEELGRARGPKPLAAVERMFVQSYVPLRDAYLRGIAPAEVGSALEGWAASFAKSYIDAFDALRVRGKRPSMVLDIPDAALRIGRLHGARSVQLLLVDGMRFDLGLRAERLLRARLGGEVALTERLLLWSALPSETNTQLTLLGRGPDALRELGRGSESDVPVARGRMAKTPRRIKTGHRELLKLDLVEARLSEPGLPEAARLDALALELAEAIAELCEKLPTRTLLVAFGDHGFLLDPQGNGTGPARQGGARPEEVLVPAFAWLVGGVQ